MKNEKMLHAIGQIDDELIHGAVNDVKAGQKKKHSWCRWAAMASPPAPLIRVTASSAEIACLEE